MTSQVSASATMSAGILWLVCAVLQARAVGALLFRPCSLVLDTGAEGVIMSSYYQGICSHAKGFAAIVVSFNHDDDQ